jgi:hypothetical protein
VRDDASRKRESGGKSSAVQENRRQYEAQKIGDQCIARGAFDAVRVPMEKRKGADQQIGRPGFCTAIPAEE